MSVIVSLYSKKNNQIDRFLSKYNKDFAHSKDATEWKKNIDNPIELADIIGVFIDNNDEFDTEYIPVGDKIAISKRRSDYE